MLAGLVLGGFAFFVGIAAGFPGAQGVHLVLEVAGGFFALGGVVGGDGFGAGLEGVGELGSGGFGQGLA